LKDIENESDDVSRKSCSSSSPQKTKSFSHRFYCSYS